MPIWMGHPNNAVWCMPECCLRCSDQFMPACSLTNLAGCKAQPALPWDAAATANNNEPDVTAHLRLAEQLANKRANCSIISKGSSREDNNDVARELLWGGRLQLYDIILTEVGVPSHPERKANPQVIVEMQVHSEAQQEP